MDDVLVNEPSSFDTMRTWGGSRARAFEELSYQLLKDTAPAGSRAIRTGNPDGGVEWYATQSDGTEIGWQAKHTHGIDSLLSGMTDSVKRVTLERPHLRKLVFVISDSLPTSTSGNEKTSARQKYEQKVDAWRTSIPGADKIEFDLVQGSDLLALLAQPKHRGRRWFWWDTTVLDEDWLRGQFRVQENAAGDKYRPDLQVDIPIQNDLAALGFDAASKGRLRDLIKGVLDAGEDLSVRPEGDASQRKLYESLHEAATALIKATGEVGVDARSRPDALASVRAAAAQFSTATSAAREREFANRRRGESLGREDPALETIGPTTIATGYAVKELLDAVDHLTDWLDGPQGQALLRPAYFLVGEAGSGKTHLLLDAVNRALSDKRPAVFVSGAQFGNALWASFTEQLGLSNIGGDVLLDAFDAAGEASALEGRRFVIFVDALNETTDPSFWTRHLPTLRAAVAERPHVALAVSCRDTYLPVVATDTELSHYLCRTHPGFAGREVEAAAKFFEHYGLEAPRHPLLTPEFSLPLFLRIYCEALRGAARSPVGHQSRTMVFESYVVVKVAAAARRVFPDAATGYELQDARQQVESVLDTFLEVMAATGGESLTDNSALEHARDTLSGDRGLAVRMISALQAEGLLTRERVWVKNEGRVDAVRIVFQAFSDFLVLRRRMREHAAPLADEGFLQWLREDAGLGVLEAASIAFPEQFGRELLDTLGIDPRALHARRAAADYEERKGLQRQVRVVQLFFSTLPHRVASSVDQRSVDLVNEARPFIQHRDLFRIMFVVAPQPDHRLNGDKLHEHLLNIEMPERDAYFGFAVHDEVVNPETPAARLTRWAAAGPYPTYEPRVIELAAIALCWLLCTPHRPQRDWVTKALSQLLSGHLDVAARLIRRFWGVNDPYIVQRVMAAGYAALLKADTAASDDGRALAQATLDTAFTAPFRADEPLLDAARSLVRVAVGQGLLSADSLVKTQRPLGISAPRMNPPTVATLEAKYGRWDEDRIKNDWYSIYGSVFGMGDFGKYIVDSAAHDFTTTPLGQPHPVVVRKRAPRPTKAAWSRFLAALTPEQKALLPKSGPNDSLALFRAKRKLALSEEQQQLYSQLTPAPRAPTGATNRRGELARRWVMARTVSLGWTPELFAEKDTEISRWRHGRESHKAERWGKKYQWIALHEYVARLADNYRPRHEDERIDFRARDIDPSLPPVPYEQFAPEDEEEEKTDSNQWRLPPTAMTTWPSPTVPFHLYNADIEEFVADVATEPTLGRIVNLTDADGDAWLILDGDVTQIDPQVVRRWRGLRQKAFISSWLVPAGTGKTVSRALANAEGLGSYEFADNNGHSSCCYIREVGTADTGCPHRHSELTQFEVGRKHASLVATTENYSWTGSGLDCSMNKNAEAAAPSAFIQSRSTLAFSEAGPSWADETGSAVFQHYWEHGSEAWALLVRSSYLAAFLEQENLELVIESSWERMNLGRPIGSRAREPYVEGKQVAWMDSSLVLETHRQRRQVDHVNAG